MISKFWSLYSQYQVQPIVMFPSDKPTDTLYLYGVKAALSDVRLWYKQKLGRTFTVGRPFIFRCPKPEANMDPLDLIPQFVAAANLCGGIANQKRVYVLFGVTNKMIGGGTTGAGTYGGNIFTYAWPPDTQGNCTFQYPGRCWMLADDLRYLVGAPPEGTPTLAYARNQNAERGALAHELTHCFGEDYHAEGWPAGDITYSWWDWPNVDFNGETRQRLLNGTVARRFLR